MIIKKHSMFIKRKIQTSKIECIVLAGDLTGFSYSYDRGNVFLVNEFIKRFYYYSSSIVNLAKGRLVKFTGDGFLAVWELSDNMNDNHITASIVDEVSREMSRAVRVSKLGMQINEKMYLRQGITVEPNGIKVKMILNGHQTIDYLGNMINFAFRIQNIEMTFPYICLHKDFHELLLDNDHQYKSVTLEPDEVKRIFKKLNPDQEKLFLDSQLSETTIDNIIESFNELDKKGMSQQNKYKGKVTWNQYLVEKAPLKRVDKKIMDYHNRKWRFYKQGPKWLNEVHYRLWGYVKALEIIVYEADNIITAHNK